MVFDNDVIFALVPLQIYALLYQALVNQEAWGACMNGIIYRPPLPKFGHAAIVRPQAAAETTQLNCSTTFASRLC